MKKDSNDKKRRTKTTRHLKRLKLTDPPITLKNATLETIDLGNGLAAVTIVGQVELIRLIGR